MSRQPANSRPLPPEAIEALSLGRKIEAIKIVRETWDISLKEAKEAVECGELEGARPAKSKRPVEIPPEAIPALMRGELIEAIRIVRSSQRIGLKEAKEAVDAHLETQPALARSVREAQAKTRRRVLNWLAWLGLAAAALYYLLPAE